MLLPSASLPEAPLTARVRAYWNDHIHDLAITSHPVGSPGFFQDLDEYHFDKLHHLVQLVPFDGLRGKRVLDVGCGTGVDLVRFAQGGAAVIGVDLADSAIALARQNFAQRRLAAKLVVGDGERLPLAEASVDYVFAHGVVQCTPTASAWWTSPSCCCGTVARPSSKSTTVSLAQRAVEAHACRSRTRRAGAPQVGPDEFRALLGGFSDVRLVFERFPVKSRLHDGWKGLAFNTMFVGTFNALPIWVERYGWHLLAFCRK